MAIGQLLVQTGETSVRDSVTCRSQKGNITHRRELFTPAKDTNWQEFQSLKPHAKAQATLAGDLALLNVTAGQTQQIASREPTHDIFPTESLAVEGIKTFPQPFGIVVADAHLHNLLRERSTCFLDALPRAGATAGTFWPLQNPKENGQDHDANSAKSSRNCNPTGMKMTKL